MTTIYDIAKRCSVSIATVSRALNGHSGVSERTRKRIMEVCEELSYYPSATARGLTLNRSWTLGVYFQDDLTHPLYQHILSSFKHSIELSGYDLLFFNTHESSVDIEQLVIRTNYRNLDGMLFSGLPDNDLPERLTHINIPCVGVNMKLEGRRARYVVSDNYGGALNAVNYLLRNGHRNIAFVGEMSFPPIYDRYLGYLDALRSLNIGPREEWVVSSHWTEEEGYAVGVSLAKNTELPSAVFCATDQQAVGMMHAFEDLGIQVGVDISIIGFDDITLARYVKPRLTTVRQDQARLGQVAARLLVDLVEGRGTPESIVIPTELVIRESVSSVRTLS